MAAPVPEITDTPSYCSIETDISLEGEHDALLIVLNP
jgi:hypothetical protein